MKSRKKVSESVLESLTQRLIEALESGARAMPFPEPPLFDADFPPIHPKGEKEISETGVALLHADQGMFDRHLSIVVDLIVPHRMNLSDDPFEVHEKFLLKRIDILNERLLFAMATEWLSQALDRTSPNPDRWWLAICLLRKESPTTSESSYQQSSLLTISRQKSILISSDLQSATSRDGKSVITT